MIDIKGIDRAELLAALYRNTKAVGLGRQHDIGEMSLDDAEFEIILSTRNGVASFDYVHGRPIKVQFNNERLWDEEIYDRYLKPGTCAAVVDRLRASMRKAGA